MEFMVATAKVRPETLGRPFTHWSIRKLRDYLANNKTRTVVIGRERLRQILERNHVTFQRTKTLGARWLWRGRGRFDDGSTAGRARGPSTSLRRLGGAAVAALEAWSRVPADRREDEEWGGRVIAGRDSTMFTCRSSR